MILQEHEHRHVLMRIYGDIIDLKQRFYECIIFTVLSERNIGPKIYGVFYSGRIEEFIDVRIHGYLHFIFENAFVKVLCFFEKWL